MAGRADLTHYMPFSGANTSSDSRVITSQHYAMGCNVMLRNGIPTTRHGVRNVPISCVNTDDMSNFSAGSGQGFKFHNPAKGQSTRLFSGSKSYIMASVSGQKYTLEISGFGGSSSAELTNITNGHSFGRQYHLVWWESAENYALANDGYSNLFIWDGQNPAFVSEGYNTTPGQKENSKLPNGGTVILYTHNRIAVVVNGRYIIYGDIIHKLNRFSPENILQATEQVHWATGPFIVPPSSMGNIMAAAILPLRDTAHGHGSDVFHCIDGGQFSVESNIALREDWARTPMIKISDLSVGAVGPYAISVIDGDQIFRSQRGIDSIRSSSRSSELEGNQVNGVGDSINDLLNLDDSNKLRFCSLDIWSDNQRLYCTIDHAVRGRWRFARALVCKNFDPVVQTSALPAWEGMMTFPKKHAGIVQMVSGRWGGRERVFAITREDNLEDPGAGVNRLVEFDDSLKYDAPEGSDCVNTVKDISCWIKTRKIHFDQPFTMKHFDNSKVFFRSIRTYETDCFKYAVFVRSDKNGGWTYYRGGRLRTDRLSFDTPSDGYDHEVVLGRLPDVHSDCKWLEFLIKWTGYAQIDTMMVVGDVDSVQNELDFRVENLNTTGKSYSESCNHKNYEYSLSDTLDWHKYLE